MKNQPVQCVECEDCCEGKQTAQLGVHRMNGDSRRLSSYAIPSISNHVMKTEERAKPTRPDSWQILVAVVEIESQK